MIRWRLLPESLELWNLIRALNDTLPTAVVSKTAAYTVIRTDEVVLADAVGGAFTVTLPTPVSIKGARYTVKRINAGVNAVTVGTAAGLIDGAATQLLATQYAKLTFVSDNANWQII